MGGGKQVADIINAREATEDEIKNSPGAGTPEGEVIKNILIRAF